MKYHLEKEEKRIQTEIANILKIKNKELEEKNEIIKQEKAREDKLLLNILPVRIVDDLKSNGKTTPDVYDNVTVYFSDIVGFTKISSS